MGFTGHFAQQQFCEAYVAHGSIASERVPSHFRFYPNLGHIAASH